MDNLDEYRDNHFSPISNKFGIINGCVLLEQFEKIRDGINGMEVREEDVWVVSFPKSGKFSC